MIAPAINKINITSEDGSYSNYQSFPILLEKRFTNALINRFNLDGHLKVVSETTDALKLECTLTDYTKEAVRFTDSDDVKEHKLHLIVHMKLTNPKGELIKDMAVEGQSSFFLSGSRRKTETVAQNELIEDAARRVLEAILEEW